MGNRVPEPVQHFPDEHMPLVASALSGETDLRLVLDHGLDPASGSMGGRMVAATQ